MPPSIVRDMLIILIRKNTGFVITAEAAGSSGRETIGRVAGGAVASLILKELGIEILAFSKAIGPVMVPEQEYDFTEIQNNKLFMPSARHAQKAEKHLESLMRETDSCGGVIECIVRGLPAGLGEPVFDKLDAELAKAILSIGAVKAMEFGEGMNVSLLNGSQNNDAFVSDCGNIRKKTNHSGGVLGGMSDGDTLIFRAAVKPTPSIARTQHTVTEAGENTELVIHGRHDPIIVPRAVVVVESMTAITLVDLLFQNMNSQMDSITRFYKKHNEDI